MSCATSACAPQYLSQLIQTSESEEGSSHISDDGWAETQKQISQIRESMADVYSFCRSNGESEVLNHVGDSHSPEQICLEPDLMNFVGIPDQYLTRHIFVGPEVVSSVDIASSVDAGTVGFEGVDSADMGVAGSAEVVGGPADSMQHFLDMGLCEQKSLRD